MNPVAIVVGLGNPGPDYASTLHNAGFCLDDRLSALCGCTLRTEAKFQGELASAYLGTARLLLFKPMTYMNRCGAAVARLVSYYQFTPEALLVAHDELDLAPGTARLKHGGGHGGHNGLRDLLQHLEHGNFWRLRLGIGHPGHKDQVTNYVLGRAGQTQQTSINAAIDSALDILPLMAVGQTEIAMQRLHTRTPPDSL